MFLRRLLVASLLAVAPSLAFLVSVSAAETNAGNRLAYLDSDDPFYPHKDFPKLITPQWVGEPGVEAVVILAIDDMRESKKYETFLRPILERLKQIDGRAPVSIFCNTVQPDDPQLQTWLKEGLSLEVHTLTHPCPLLQKGSFTNAWNTYHGGVDLLNQVPGNKPVAFRMPCCDSMNSPSPRFYAEIFNRPSPAGNFLQIDSSVMCLLTDLATNSSPSPLPPAGERAGARGQPETPNSKLQTLSPARPAGRFAKYFPSQTNAVTRKSLANFATYIEDYPYPYVINKVCWEFPAMVPSDWEAFNLHGPTNAVTLADWKAALDIVVRKQGVFTWIFHPHGWSSPQQIVEFIDHAVTTHGKKVKFLTFKEAAERLNGNLLTQRDIPNDTEKKITYPLRGWPHKPNLKPTEGTWILDINNDGFQDVLMHSGVEIFLYRLWDLESKSWKEGWLDKFYIDGRGHVDFTRLSFGVLPSVSGSAVTYGYGSYGRLQVFDKMRWEGWGLVADQRDAASGRPPTMGFKFLTPELDPGIDQGVRLRDMDHDGISELVIANSTQQDVYARTELGEWKKLPDGTWPAGVALVNERGEDNGVRFVDVNGDGFEDLLYSNEKEYALWLYIHTPKKHLGWERGWTYKVRDGKRGAPASGPAQASDNTKRAGSETGAPSDPPPSALRPLSSEIPPIVRAGPHRNNGVWFRHGAMWVQNEDTAHLPDVVQRIPFSELLTGGEVPPKSPEESLKCFDVRPGFQIELVASEPLVLDPVAFEWGADGRLWVVEMADYPSGITERGSPTRSSSETIDALRLTEPRSNGVRGGGRVIFLTDTNADGRYDTRTVFLDGLNFPSGVMPWRKGVLISAAPDILYAEDTDGDGKADLRKVLLTGFREGNQQHRVNGFEYGLDGWVYAANGDSGGVITRVNRVLTTQPSTLNSQPIDIRGHDIRFQPDTGEIELVAGQTQFGRRRDDWGNWFGNNNPTWLWHYHLPIHYLKRNPHLAVKSVRTVLANYDNANRVFATSTPQARFNWADRTFQTTSACSPCPYRDDLFGPDFATSVFISEPANNVVHREVLEPDGVTFRSRRADDERDREFLASTDNWFRPTMLKTGPDGALYIADMYRLILEHPEYFPEEMKTRPDLRAGDDKGRIWRVYPKGATLRKVPKLDKLSTTDLVAALDSPSGWQRDTVQRLVTERFGKGDGNAKERHAVFKQLLIEMTQKQNPKVRLQAYATVFSMGYGSYPVIEDVSSSPSVMVNGSLDEHPYVQAFALTHAEAKFPNVLFRPNADIRARFVTAFRLGDVTDPIAGHILGEMALYDWDDPNMRTAILSSALPHLARMLDAVLGKGRRGQGDVWRIGDILRELVGLGVSANDKEALRLGLGGMTGDSSGAFATWYLSGLAGFVEAAERRNTSLPKLAAEAGIGVDPLFAQARKSVGDAASETSTRTTAIRLLARGPNQQEQDLKTLGELLGPQQPTEIQRAALDSLKGLRLPAVGQTLLAGWKSFGPAMRGEVLSAVLTRNEWTLALLQAVEGGAVAAGEIGATQRQKLLTHASAPIRERAQKLFAAVNTDRQAVVKRYAGVAELQGDTKRGATLFATHCATCHQFKGQGFTVGPDLGTMADKSVASLLTALLDPGQAVDAAYTAYTVTMKDGREFAGIIAAETPNSLTLRLPGGTEEVALRSQISVFRASTLSLMPEGLEATLQLQDMADLIAYLLAP
jgi:putative membrane-bound dehydrogenase-like protein